MESESWAVYRPYHINHTHSAYSRGNDRARCRSRIKSWAWWVCVLYWFILQRYVVPTNRAKPTVVHVERTQAWIWKQSSNNTIICLPTHAHAPISYWARELRPLTSWMVMNEPNRTKALHAQHRTHGEWNAAAPTVANNTHRRSRKRMLYAVCSAFISNNQFAQSIFSRNEIFSVILFCLHTFGLNGRAKRLGVCIIRITNGLQSIMYIEQYSTEYAGICYAQTIHSDFSSYFSFFLWFHLFFFPGVDQVRNRDG